MTENEAKLFEAVDIMVRDYMEENNGESPFLSIEEKTDENGEPIVEDGQVRMTIDMAKDFEDSLEHKFKGKTNHAMEVYLNEVMRLIVEEIKEASEALDKKEESND